MCSTDAKNDLTITDSGASCSCCAAPASEQKPDQAVAADAITAEYLVSGMTCSHCVSSVTEELSELDGVQSVNVDLTAGGVSRVTVFSASALDEEKVRAAVSEAGYDLVPAGR